MAKYLTAAEIRTIAATLPNLAALIALNDVSLNALSELASDRFDTARRYQGRKYDPTQALEFPRLAYERGNASSAPGFPLTLNAVADTIWDWDDTADAAVVPDRVKRAIVLEAESIRVGTRDRLAQAHHDGLVSQKTGDIWEEYAKQATATLCMEADRISRQYELRSGSLR